MVDDRQMTTATGQLAFLIEPAPKVPPGTRLRIRLLAPNQNSIVICKQGKVIHANCYHVEAEPRLLGSRQASKNRLKTEGENNHSGIV